MTDSDVLASVFLLNPRTGERARRLACAVHLLRGGMTRTECVAQLRVRFGILQPVAWRVVDMASDMAGDCACPHKVKS